MYTELDLQYEIKLKYVTHYNIYDIKNIICCIKTDRTIAQQKTATKKTIKFYSHCAYNKTISISQHLSQKLI